MSASSSMMYLLYEDGGDIKLAAQISADTTASETLAIESLGGKRGKLKAKEVWHRFSHEKPGELLEEATQKVGQLDLDFLWECAGQEEFYFLDLAKEYFGSQVSDLDVLTLAIGLQGSPIYFRRKGRGHFLRAPQEQLKAGLLAMERKKLEQEKQVQWEASLKDGVLPEEFKDLVNSLLFNPDKNSTAYKAVAAASQGLPGGVAELLMKCGALSDSRMYHEGKFFKEYFPKGTHFQFDMTAEQVQQWQAAIDSLSVAQVRAFSIDDSSTTEIDDAFSVTRLEKDKLIQVGVHIAIPGLVIQKQDELDHIARQRLSTVYYPGHKVTMLPDEVVQYFSLNQSDAAVTEGALRPALSLYVYLDEEYKPILEGDRAPVTRMERVPMQANLRLDQLEERVTEEALQDGQAKDLPFAQELNCLWQAAKAMHAQRQVKRVETGLKEEVLGLADPTALAKDFSFKVDGDHVDIYPRARGSVLDTIVAEWMIFANSTWGHQLSSHDVPGIYRVQKGWGAQRTKMQISPGPHEGLGVENYTWCTSPLRRYADLVNQWQLIAMVTHGVTAKLVAPFKPKDADLMAIASDFDGTYGAYGEYQNRMEHFWCLKYLLQLGLPQTLVVRHLKEGVCRVEPIPLRLTVPELSSHARGVRAQVQVLDVNLLLLETSVRYLGVLDEPVVASDATEE